MDQRRQPFEWSRHSSGARNLGKRMLENAPTYDMDEDFRWTPDYGRQVDKYYNAPTYW
jgi:hypothetical protein